MYLWLQTLLFVYILWDLYRTKAALLAGLQAYVLGAYTAVGGAVLNYVQSNAFYTNEERYSLGNTNPDGYGFILALGIPSPVTWRHRRRPRRSSGSSTSAICLWRSSGWHSRARGPRRWGRPSVSCTASPR